MTGTFAHEDDLPRVPVPDLATSRDQLLQWCAPLVDAEQYEATRAAVDAFVAGDGPILQAALEEYAANAHTWLDDFWATRYLGRRDRIALNANFFFLFEAGEPDRADRAAGLIIAALAYHRAVTDETLPPATRRDRPTTMAQNRFLFSATRIPGEVQDTARTPYSEDHPGPSTARHVVVFVHGRPVRLDVVGHGGVPHTPRRSPGPCARWRRPSPPGRPPPSGT